MEQRVAMISGANRGIGAAIARHLAGCGWRLSLGVRDPAKLVAAAGQIVCRFDATDPASETAWVAATEAAFGRIDAIVNNAGVMIPKTILEAEDAELVAMFEVNVRSPLRLVRAAWPLLAASGRGRVVTIASLSGKRVKSARSSLYSITKFAALALSHGIRQCGWDSGIRATAICPGFVATEMGLASRRPPEELTQPEDIARMVALVLDLPNTANVAELAVSFALEDFF